MRRALALVALLLAGCGGGETGRELRDASPRALVDVTTVGAFASAFDADADVPRLVLVFAPT